MAGRSGPQGRPGTGQIDHSLVVLFVRQVERVLFLRDLGLEVATCASVALIWACAGETEPDASVEDVVVEDAAEPDCEGLEVELEGEVDALSEEPPAVVAAAPAAADCQPKPRMIMAQSRTAATGWAVGASR